LNTLLAPHEARIIACLIEKEITTPEQYPLSLNALTNACNQKSNRDPVLDLDELAVRRALDGLVKRHLVVDKAGFGSRVTKFQHRFCNTEFGTYRFTEQELGVLCELLLRGPQTPGELRTHTERLCKFSDVHEVEATLTRLTEREDGPFVVRLARVPGKREARYAHLFCGAPPIAAAVPSSAADTYAPGSEAARITHLEHVVDELREELERIKLEVDRLGGRSQSD
jgi:uncharacterized protein YceH (UPF0502 family)